MDHIFLFLLHMSNILKIILQCCQKEVIENLSYLPLMGVDASSIRSLNYWKILLILLGFVLLFVRQFCFSFVLNPEAWPFLWGMGLTPKAWFLYSFCWMHEVLSKVSPLWLVPYYCVSSTAQLVISWPSSLICSSHSLLGLMKSHPAHELWGNIHAVFIVPFLFTIPFWYSAVQIPGSTAILNSICPSLAQQDFHIPLNSTSLQSSWCPQGESWKRRGALFVFPFSWGSQSYSVYCQMPAVSYLRYL